MFHSQWSKYQFSFLTKGLTHSPKTIICKIKVKGPCELNIQWQFLPASFHSYHLSLQNIGETVLLMDSLGLTVQRHKSIFDPTQEIILMGFLLCSVTMTARMPPERVQEITTFCTYVLFKRRVYNQKILSIDWEAGIQTTRNCFTDHWQKVEEWDLKNIMVIITILWQSQSM